MSYGPVGSCLLQTFSFVLNSKSEFTRSPLQSVLSEQHSEKHPLGCLVKFRQSFCWFLYLL